MDNIILTGILTSRIETRQDKIIRQDYHYGFFKLEGYEQEIPVVFNHKPNLVKGSQVELTGTWANSRKDRPSFTCYGYDVIGEPDPPSLPSLQKELSLLLRPALEKKKSWSEITDFLFKKQKDLEEIRKVSHLGKNYLQAYLLTKQVFYANYQTEHLEQANFTLQSYLNRIASELEVTKRQMLATGWREVK